MFVGWSPGSWWSPYSDEKQFSNFIRPLLPKLIKLASFWGISSGPAWSAGPRWSAQNCNDSEHGPSTNCWNFTKNISHKFRKFSAIFLPWSCCSPGWARCTRPSRPSSRPPKCSWSPQCSRRLRPAVTSHRRSWPLKFPRNTCNKVIEKVLIWILINYFVIQCMIKSAYYPRVRKKAYYPRVRKNSRPKSLDCLIQSWN